MSSSIDQLKQIAAEAAASVGPPGYGAKIEAAMQTLSSMIPQIAMAHGLSIHAMVPIMACVAGTAIRQGLSPAERGAMVKRMADIIDHFSIDREDGQ